MQALIMHVAHVMEERYDRKGTPTDAKVLRSRIERNVRPIYGVVTKASRADAKRPSRCGFIS